MKSGKVTFRMYDLVRILNCDIHNITRQELLNSLKEGVVVTPNIDHLMRLQKDEEFYKLYKMSDYRVCDSRIIFLLNKALFPQKVLKEQITGSDFFPAFCQHHEKNQNISIFLLGGSESSVEIAKNKINERSSRNIVVDCYSPPFGFEHSIEENQKIIEKINASQATTIAVGVGSPKQEKWIFAHKDKLIHAKIFLAIGATIEFESGSLKRSPKWMSKCGLEWLYRMSQEPKRLVKRYLVDDLPFLWLYIKQRFGYYKNPW